MTEGGRQIAKPVVTWWDTPARPRQACALAAAIGFLVYMVVYGPGHLLGTSSYWDMPQDDSRAYLMAYRYFLHEPWHWPIFTSHTINVPYTKSFALSDGIPIWALVNKAIATVIPPWESFSSRAYLGTWHAVSHVLQPCLGVAIMRLFGHRTRGATILAAVFFLALPSWIFRYQHAALSAHFLILWPIYLYLRTPVNGVPPTKLQLAWLCELAVVAMVNPYHVVMSFGLFAAALLRARRLRALVWLPASLGAIGIAAWFVGYLARATVTPMGGFDAYSTNMMSMFIPPNSGIIGDARGWFGDIEPIWNQYEGMAYLGLGMVVLFALFLPHARSLRGVIKRHAGLFVLALGAWCLALSNHIYFLSFRAFEYNLPRSLHFVGDWFRAPGRFVWLPMYVVIVFLLQRAFTRFTSGWKRLVLPALAVIQLVDASGEWRFQHDYTQSPFEHQLPMEPWQKLVRSHDAVFELPTYDCLGSLWPKLKPALEIAYYASDRALPINGVYGARPVRDCTEDEREFLGIEPASNTLYVWFTTTDRHARRFESLGATCALFEYGRVCSKNTGAITEAIHSGAFQPLPRTTPPAPTLAYGQPIVFGQNGTLDFLTDGWSWPEPEGQWTDGPMASVQLHLAGEPPPHAVMKLRAASVMCGRRRSQDVEIALNDKRIGTLHFDRTANDIEEVRSIAIPDAALLAGPNVIVDFKPRDIRPPNTVRCNPDARRIGVWLRDLWFEPEP